jgi:Kef-type K+ transport system membrane component KefB
MTCTPVSAIDLPRTYAWWRLTVFYLLLTAGGIGCFFGIRSIGEQLPQPRSTAAESIAPAAPPPAPAAEALPKLLLALAAVILTGRVLASLLERLAQPPVIGEVLAGILLGPSLFTPLGWEESPLLPADVAPYLSVIAHLGVILYMFVVGIDFNADLLRSKAQAALAISHASILIPFLLGSALALYLYEPLAPSGVSFTSFALFIAVALAVTAFPVLARILTDCKLARTPLGVMALSCAAVDDVTAWCLLALVSGVVQSQVGSAVQVVVGSLMYVGFMLVVVRPLASRWIRHSKSAELTPTMVTIIFAALLFSALATERIGIHAVFGAFLFGVVIPHDSPLGQSLHKSLQAVVTTLLLPAFFAFTGLRTQIGLVSGTQAWWMCGLIIAAASIGKFGGTLAAARLAGLDWRTGSSLGILMNTRGLMELIVLNVGLDLGVISPTLFAMMVIMALVTTLATTPLLALVPPRSVDRATAG